MKRKMKLIKHNSAGFSLVELMVVIGIVGMLAAMASQKINVYKIKASRAESHTNIKMMRALIVSYYSENQTLPVFPTGIGSETVQGGWYPLVKDDISATNSCNSDNIFGIHLSSCQKARYSYWYTGGPASYAIGAWNNGKICPNIWAGEAMVYCPAIDGFFLRKDAVVNDCADVLMAGWPAPCQGLDK